jgi:hypothetical protein
VCGTLLQDRERHGCRARAHTDVLVASPEVRYRMTSAPIRVMSAGARYSRISWKRTFIVLILLSACLDRPNIILMNALFVDQSACDRFVIFLGEIV